MKEKIIESSISYLKDHDLNDFTLDIAAKEAGVSKGGLLHHFKTKKDLLENIAETILEDYVALILNNYEVQSNQGNITRAFIVAAKKDLLENKATFNIALAIGEQVGKPLSQNYDNLLEQMLKDDGLVKEEVLLIRLVLDGLYYAEYLNLAPVSEEDTITILDKLTAMTKKRRLS